MVTLVDYMLEPTGQSLLGSPQIAKALEEGMLVGTADSVEFKNAPLFLKESLTFPYRYGLDFEGRAAAQRRQAESIRRNSRQSAAEHTSNHGAENVSFRRAAGADARCQISTAILRITSVSILAPWGNSTLRF